MIKVISITLIPYSLCVMSAYLTFVLLGKHGRLDYINIKDIFIMIYSLGHLLNSIFLFLLIFFNLNHNTKKRILIGIKIGLPLLILGVIYSEVLTMIGIYNNQYIKLLMLSIII